EENAERFPRRHTLGEQHGVVRALGRTGHEQLRTQTLRYRRKRRGFGKNETPRGTAQASRGDSVSVATRQKDARNATKRPRSVKARFAAQGSAGTSMAAQMEKNPAKIPGEANLRG